MLLIKNIRIIAMVKNEIELYFDEFDDRRSHKNDKSFKKFSEWLFNSTKKLPETVNITHIINWINSITYKLITFNDIHSQQLAIQIIRSITTHMRHELENLYL